MSTEMLVEVWKHWPRGKGKWTMEPSLEEATGNWASREGFWLMTFVGDKRGRHEAPDIAGSSQPSQTGEKP